MFLGLVYLCPMTSYNPDSVLDDNKQKQYKTSSSGKQQTGNKETIPQHFIIDDIIGDERVIFERDSVLKINTLYVERECIAILYIDSLKNDPKIECVEFHTHQGVSRTHDPGLLGYLQTRFDNYLKKIL